MRDTKTELQRMIGDAIRTEGRERVAVSYGIRGNIKQYTQEELVEMCVAVEIRNYFK